MELYKKLSAIQQIIKVPKSHVNNFANFKYRNAEDILSAVKPLLDGCVLTLSDEVKVISEYVYVEATAEIRLGEEVIKNKAQAFIDLHKKGMSDEQKTGSASSYARKYALNGLFLLDDNQDPDSLKNATESDYVPTTEVKDAFKDL